MPKKIITSLVFIFILLSTACSKQDKTLTSANLSDFIPPNPQIMVTISSYQKFIKELFSISAYFFEKDTIRELKNKLFLPLKNQLGLNLLNKSKLSKAGFNINKSCLIAIYSHNQFYISLPIDSSKKVIKYLKRSNPMGINLKDNNKIRKATNEQFIFLISSKRLFIINKKIHCPKA